MCTYICEMCQLINVYIYIAIKGKRNLVHGKTIPEVQQELFIAYAKDSYLYNFFAVMLRANMRSGEMRGLKYADIDKRLRVAAGVWYDKTKSVPFSKEIFNPEAE